MYIWGNGVGWIQFEPDASKRRKFMDDYFGIVLAGYRSETNLEDSMLDKADSRRWDFSMRFTLVKNRLSMRNEIFSLLVCS